MGSRDLSGNIKAQTRAGRQMAYASAAVKTLKNSILVPSRNRTSAIGDPNRYLILVLFNVDIYGGSWV
jgi:hypothetical protein